MPIQPGQIARADDHIFNNERSISPASDRGRVVKLESDAKIHGNFLRDEQFQIFDDVGNEFGATNSQFDITNPSGTTFRYTWDGNGADPGITALTFPTGDLVKINSTNFNANNNGNFVITNSDTDWFEIDNSAGVAEINQDLGKDNALIVQATYIWTKPDGLRYVVVEVVGSGGGGHGEEDSDSGVFVAGGGGGGYSSKKILAADLGATEFVPVGRGGGGGSVNSNGFAGETSYFGAHLQATGGNGGGQEVGNFKSGGGIGSGGDLNVRGGPGDNNSEQDYANGGNSVLGGGGAGNNNNDTNGEDGGDYGGGGASGGASSTPSGSGGRGGRGVVIVREVF